jgi:hypothetical protein
VPEPSAKVIAIACWGVFGVVAILVRAIVALTPIALEPIERGQLDAFGWALYVSWVVINGYAEGYRGFQLAFSPRVVARAMHLAEHPTWWRVVLAAPYCMALFDASKRKLIGAWALLAGITALVISVRMLPQPWRGIVDGGVVVGLAWGTLSLVAIFARALVSGVVPPNDSLPDRAISTASVRD